jgi:hypothetical protein
MPLGFSPRAMPEAEIRFFTEQVATGSFRLLELQPDLSKLIEFFGGQPKVCIDMVDAIRLFPIYALV